MAIFYGTNLADEFSIFGNSSGIVSNPPGATALTDNGDLMFGYAGNDNVYGGDGEDTIHGGAGDDTLDGGYVGLDRLFGEDGQDFIFLAFTGGGYAEGGAGKDNIFGGLLDSTLSGGTGADELAGVDGDDLLIGGAGADLLWGREGRDLLRGGSGDDTLMGGYEGARDTMIGGEGDDVFRPNDNPFAPEVDRTGVYLIRAAYSSTVPAFEGAGEAGGDSIDLRFIEANRLNEAEVPFVFKGRGAGHFWLEERGTQTLILMNTDADARAEFQIAIDDGVTRAGDYTVDDFIL